MPDSQDGVRLLLGFWQGDQRLPVDEPSAHDGSNRMMGPALGANGRNREGNHDAGGNLYSHGSI